MNSSAQGFAVRLAAYYAAIFANLGLYLPFMPIWLAWRGMSPYEIGVITSAPLFIRVLATPSIGLWSDRRGDHRPTIIIGGWLSLVSAVGLAFSSSFWPILLWVMVFQIATQSILPLVETTALAGARRHGLDYGRMRLWGSAAFIAANIVGGFIIARYGGPSIMFMVLAAVCATAFAAHALPGNPRGANPQLAAAARPAAGFGDVMRLVVTPWFLFTMLAAGLIQGSHAVYYAFGAIHWRSLAIADNWIGLLWALGVAAEIVLFAFSGRVLARLGAIGLLVLGGCGSVVRWAVMAFDPVFWLLFPLQCLHALSFGATYLGTLNIIQTHVTDRYAGSAQSIHSALSAGIIMGGLTFLAGVIYAPLGADSYLLMAAVAIAGTGLVIPLVKVLPTAARAPAS